MDADISAALQRVAIFMPTFLFALVFHEFAHAWTANRFGDKTSEWSGRLTLNPVAHMDPFGTILFPLMSILLGSSIFFGWAKPVPINPNQFSNYRKGLFWVSFAGPLSNILLGFLAAIALVAFSAYGPQSSGFYEPLHAMIESFLVLNFSLAVFNLIPLPPLDGSNIVLSFLDYNASRKFLMIQQYSFMIFLFLMFSGAFNLLRYPILFLLKISINLATALFGFASPGLSV